MKMKGLKERREKLKEKAEKVAEEVEDLIEQVSSEEIAQRVKGGFFLFNMKEEARDTFEDFKDAASKCQLKKVIEKRGKNGADP